MLRQIIEALRGGGRIGGAATPEMRANVLRDLPTIRQNLIDYEGFTYDHVLGDFITPQAYGGGPDVAGYAVSINPRTGEILLGSPGQVDEADLLQAYDDLVSSGTLTPGVNFGGFFSKESQKYAIDPSEVIMNRRAAMRSGRRNDQEAVFNLADPDETTANIGTAALRREFRNKDMMRAAQLAALLGLTQTMRGDQ